MTQKHKCKCEQLPYHEKFKEDCKCECHKPQEKSVVDIFRETFAEYARNERLSEPAFIVWAENFILSLQKETDDKWKDIIKNSTIEMECPKCKNHYWLKGENGTNINQLN